MSYLLESLGRGLLAHVLGAFENQLPKTSDPLELLAERAALSPDSVDLALQLGAAQLRELNLAEAESDFRRAAEQDPGVLPLLGLACVHDERGEFVEASAMLRQAALLDPRDPAIAFARGFVAERMRQEAEAKGFYQTALTLCPQLRNAHERLAAIAIVHGDFAAAQRHYSDLAELEPEDMDVMLTLAALALARGDFEQAAERFQRALLVEPQIAEDDAEYASVGSEVSVTDAIDAHRELVARFPGVTEFHVQLGDLYVKAGNDACAVEEYQTAIELQPNFLEATVKLGTQHLRSQRYDEAARVFNRATELNDRLMIGFIGLGVAQRHAGHALDAEATFELAAGLAPNSTLLFSEANRLHLKSLSERDGTLIPSIETERPDDLVREALTRHQQALLRCPEHADLHYRCAMLHRQLEQVAECVSELRQCVALDQQCVRAHAKLGCALHELRDAENAIAAFEAMFTIDDHAVQSCYDLALSFAQRCQFELALDHLDEQYDRPNQRFAARENLMLALQHVGMIDRAEAAWQALVRLTPPLSLRLEDRMTQIGPLEVDLC